MTDLVVTGGCQCGAVRYRLTEKPQAEFCHCRMCQRATGGIFGALATVPKASFSWTAGSPSFFESSTAAKRGFCSACGTPLTFAYNESKSLDVTIGSLDDPEVAGPNRMHFAVESRVSWAPICDEARQERLDEYADSPVHKPGFQSFQSSGGGPE